MLGTYWEQTDIMVITATRGENTTIHRQQCPPATKTLAPDREEPALICPLCHHTDTVFYHADTRRPYHQCRQCALVFVPPAWHLAPDAEKARYDLHNNDPDDPGYRRFLSQLLVPVCTQVARPARGLDFGCGPAPVLAALFTAAGYEMAIYDPFYAPDPTPLAETYDFVSASEVAEHLYAPGAVFAQLLALVRPGGWLAFMTGLVPGKDAFAHWHYTFDPTHVCFFSRETFAWWARTTGCALRFPGRNVILLRKPPHPSSPP